MTSCILVGASTGGPPMVTQLLTSFTSEWTPSVVVVQHLPAGFDDGFANRLQSATRFSVVIAEEGMVLQPAMVMLAPAGTHLIFGYDEYQRVVAHLSNEPKQFGLRPTVNRTAQSLAPLFKEKLAGVVLTGMGEDGAEGMAMIKAFGGTVIAQDQLSSAVYGMPKVIAERNLADAILPVPLIVPTLRNLLAV